MPRALFNLPTTLRYAILDLALSKSSQKAAEILEWSSRIPVRTGLQEIMAWLWEGRENEDG